MMSITSSRPNSHRIKFVVLGHSSSTYHHLHWWSGREGPEPILSMDLDRDMNPFGPSLNRRPFRGIFSVADHVFGKPKGLEDNPFAEESDCPPPGNDTISQPPTALEEVEQGLRYVGLHARRKFSDAKKKMRLRAGLQGFFEGESLGNEEKPPRRANPSPMDVDDCVKAENDWMDVLSDIECVRLLVVLGLMGPEAATLAVLSCSSNHATPFHFEPVIASRTS